jgi:mono/diheme cytochrome c family protein
VATWQDISSFGANVKNSIFLAIVIMLSTSGLAGAQEAASRESSSRTHGTASQVARGKYIVEGVARCEQCHTPRDSSGALDESHRLEGAPVWLKPPNPGTDWPIVAPRIGGSPPASDAEMVKLLTTGIWRNGVRLRQPMPQFRMTREDAEAVVAYLKSLTSSK